MHLYELVGRQTPTATETNPKIYRMKIFAADEVRAKSMFWGFMRRLQRVKRSNGQLLQIREVLTFPLL